MACFVVFYFSDDEDSQICERIVNRLRHLSSAVISDMFIPFIQTILRVKNKPDLVVTLVTIMIIEKTVPLL